MGRRLFRGLSAATYAGGRRALCHTPPRQVADLEGRGFLPEVGMMDGVFRTMPEERDVTIQHLDQLECHVKRELLDYYDRVGGWVWYYLTDRNITLPELVHAFQGGNCASLEHLIDKGALSIHRSLKFIPGDDFRCIYYRDAVFFIAPCRFTGEG